MQINVHLTDGSVESFMQTDRNKADSIRQNGDPARLFSRQRLVIAGTCFKAVFVCTEIVRIDFIEQTIDGCDFPAGYSDVVELSEAEFIKHTHLNQPELMPARDNYTPVGDLLVSFLKLHFKNCPPVFVMVEFPVKLPVENQCFMRFLLSKSAFNMRLACGGVAVVNLSNLAAYTVYPGVAEIPNDAWLAERFSTGSDRRHD
jgi:hypothetical protein